MKQSFKLHIESCYSLRTSIPAATSGEFFKTKLVNRIELSMMSLSLMLLHHGSFLECPIAKYDTNHLSDYHSSSLVGRTRDNGSALLSNVCEYAPLFPRGI